MAEDIPGAYLAFAAGLLSVLSPCVLPLMPAYLSLISGISVEDLREGHDDAMLRR
ncbi:MAG TPA: cytochrome c biogenesis protein CcdA, partial [Myxococcota bacterium]